MSHHHHHGGEHTKIIKNNKSLSIHRYGTLLFGGRVEGPGGPTTYLEIQEKPSKTLPAEETKVKLFDLLLWPATLPRPIPSPVYHTTQPRTGNFPSSHPPFLIHPSPYARVRERVSSIHRRTIHPKRGALIHPARV